MLLLHFLRICGHLCTSQSGEEPLVGSKYIPKRYILASLRRVLLATSPVPPGAHYAHEHLVRERQKEGKEEISGLSSWALSPESTSFIFSRQQIFLLSRVSAVGAMSLSRGPSHEGGRASTDHGDSSTNDDSSGVLVEAGPSDVERVLSVWFDGSSTENHRTKWFAQVLPCAFVPPCTVVCQIQLSAAVGALPSSFVSRQSPDTMLNPPVCVWSGRLKPQSQIVLPPTPLGMTRERPLRAWTQQSEGTSAIWCFGRRAGR